jgi:hypothetical protein
MKKIEKNYVYNLNQIFMVYGCKWTRHLLRLNREGIPKLACDHVSVNIRSVGHQKLRMQTPVLMKAKRRRY